MSGSQSFYEQPRTTRSRIPISNFMKSRIPIQAISNNIIVVREQENLYDHQPLRIPSTRTAFSGSSSNIMKVNKTLPNLDVNRNANAHTFHFRERVDFESQNLMQIINNWEQYKKNRSDPLFLNEIELVISQVRCITAKFGRFRKMINIWEEGKTDITDVEEHWKILSFEIQLCYAALKKLDILKLSCNNDVPTLDNVKQFNETPASPVNKAKSKSRKSKKTPVDIDCHRKDQEQKSATKKMQSKSKINTEETSATDRFERSPIKTRSKSHVIQIRNTEKLRKCSNCDLSKSSEQKLKTRKVALTGIDCSEREIQPALSSSPTQNKIENV